MKSRIMAALGYMGVLCLVPLILNQGDRFVDFHARQGLVLWVWSVLALFCMHLPGVGPYLFSTSVVGVTFLSLCGLLAVLLGRSWEIPLIAKVAGVTDPDSRETA
ncbi:MAG: hypothetical protein HQM03_06920 [Magnetococcales bacterium]|nr:hypothetical protein [Magnetococcales bacterium]